MDKKQKSTLIILWTYFLNILLAIGILTFISDIGPDWIHWDGFFEYFTEGFRKIRNIVLFPLTFFISLFKVAIPEWVRTYVFLGILLLLSYNRAYRKIRNENSESSLAEFILTGFHPETAKNILFRIFLWPFSLTGMIGSITAPKSEALHPVNKEWGKNLLIALIVAILIWFIHRFF